ncbi:MAG: helix-turn-helix domain-containing protein [Bacteroidota bacterium]
MIRTFGDPACGIAAAVEALGDGWAPLILREAFAGTQRFTDFQSRLGIARNLLSRRLAHLVDTGLLKKEDVGQYGERYEYRLTEKGWDFIHTLTALREWGERWGVHGEHRATTPLIDQTTQEVLPPVRIRYADGRPVPVQHLRSVPEPDAHDHTRRRAQDTMDGTPRT